ncbi:MAG: cytochrome P450 [Chitinophagales bacterium]
MNQQKAQLSDIPGDWGLPFFGDMFKFLKNPIQLYKDKQEKYGDVFKMQYFGKTQLVLLDKAANQFLLIEQGKYTSNEQAWEFPLKDLFPNGLMLMDGERHQYHRNILRTAFEKDPMNGYLEMMLPIIEDFVESWRTQKKVFAFNAYKELTLQMAGKVFFGLDFSKDLAIVNQHIIEVVKAATAIPVAIPFSTYARGVKARKKLEAYFKTLIAQKRANPQKDLFSLLCFAKSEEGNQLSDQEIVDHLIFILMAAHDTTASTLTSLTYLLAKNPTWQQRVRKEATQLDLNNLKEVKDLRILEDMDLAIKEALRLYPPLILLPRVSTHAMQFGDYAIPANTRLGVVLQHNHYNDELWKKPEQFDPERFDKERKEHRKCPHAYAPFGAGKHHCIGFAFAEMQIKLIMNHLLQQFEWTVPENYKAPYRAVPLQEPTDGLPIYLKSL